MRARIRVFRMKTLDLAHLGPRPAFAEGLCTSRELALLGFDDRSVPDLIAEGVVVRVRRGCFRLKGQAEPDRPSHERERSERLLQIRAHAWTRFSPDRAWNFSYAAVSAAALIGLSLWTSERRVHIVQSFKSSYRDHAPDVVKVYRPDVPTQSLDGLPCTSPSETVIDCLRILPREPAMIVCESALATSLVDADSLLEAVKRARHRRGVAAARAVLEEASGLSESPGETRVRMLLRSLPIPAPLQQWGVAVDGRTYRLDFAWPDLRVALEFDGRMKYFGPAPTAEVLLRERERETALSHAGWVVVRLRWEDLAHPRRVLALLERAFERARRYRSA